MYFFPQEQARILWSCKLNKITEFQVYRQNPNEPEPYYYKHLNLSKGNCCKNWKDLNQTELTLEIFRLFLDYDFGDKEFKNHCLIQCGQIYELIDFRKMIKTIICNDETQEDFELQYYCEEI